MPKVLVVDDNRTYLETISSLLSNSGLEVSTAMDHGWCRSYGYYP